MKTVLLLVPLLLLCGCGDGSHPPGLTSPTDLTVGERIWIYSITPGSGVVGGPDVTVTIKGKNFVAPQGNVSSWAVWLIDGVQTDLRTTFVNTTEVTAVVPSSLLTSRATANIFVEIGDPMGAADGVLYPKSNWVAFPVAPPPPYLTLVTPSSAPAGSSDLTITVKGSDFRNKFADSSWVVWYADGNLTSLASNFVSSNELRAVVPAALLARAGTGQVGVLTGDPMWDGDWRPPQVMLPFTIVTSAATSH